MHSFRSRRKYLSLSDDEIDELTAQSRSRWAPCFYVLIGVQFVGPLVVFMLAVPGLIELPTAARMAISAPAIAVLWFGPRWLNPWLQPLRVASIQVALLRHLAKLHSRAG